MTGDGTSALISGIVALIVSSIVSWIVAHRTIKADGKRALHDQVQKIIDLTIDYPYLDDDGFCQNWLNLRAARPDDCSRYSSYCCSVFNLIENISDYCGGNRTEIRKIFHVDELIWRHRLWWTHDKENQKGYKIGVREFISATIKQREEEEGQ